MVKAMGVGKVALLSFIAIFFAVGSSSDSEEYGLNEAEYESLNEFVDAIREHEESDKETFQDDIAELGPEYENVLPSLGHLYDKYTYERVPEHSLQRRIGKAYEKVLEEPCEETDGQENEQNHPHTHVGSLPGRPGIDYPNYEEIPLTSFSCAGRHTPGFYADVETACQVFHVCYPHRRESFLCPPGTTFNQPILACDYWYNGNCSTAPEYYDVDEETPVEVDEAIEDLISSVVEEISKTDATEDFTVEPTEPISLIDVRELVTPKPVEKVFPTIEPETTRQIVQPQVKKVSIPKFVKFLPVKAAVTKLAVPAAASLAKAKMIPKMKVKAKVVSVPIAKPKIVVPAFKTKVVASKAVPVAKLVKAKVVVPKVKKAVAADILLAKKVKLLKPLVLKKAIAADKALLAKAKAAKLAAVPVASVVTKKHLTSALLKVLQAHKQTALNNAVLTSGSYY